MHCNNKCDRYQTRMHSSRMHTARSSSHRGRGASGDASWGYLLPGGGGVSLPGGLRARGVSPATGGCLPAGGISLLVGLLPGGCLLPGEGGLPAGGFPCQGGSFPGGCLLLGGCLLPGGSPWWETPSVNRMTNRCNNITLPQASFAGGNYMVTEQKSKLTNILLQFKN